MKYEFGQLVFVHGEVKYKGIDCRVASNARVICDYGNDWVQLMIPEIGCDKEVEVDVHKSIVIPIIH